MKKQVNIRLEEKIKKKANHDRVKLGMNLTAYLTMLILMGVRDDK